MGSIEEFFGYLPNLNDEDPFQLWVTDQPEGKGKKLLTLTVSAENG